jgi:hypothetical protein
MDSKPTQDMAPAAVAAPPPPAVYLLVQNPVVTSDNDHFKKTFPARTVNILAIIQIVSCFCSIISHIVLLCSVGRYGGIELSGSGIGCGIFFGFSGIIGCLAARHLFTGRIIAFMVMSVISSCFCLPLLILVAVGLGMAEDRRRYPSPYYPNVEPLGENWFFSAVAFNAIEIILALITAVVAITSSAYSCKAVCCRKTKTQGTVLYNPAGFQGLPAGLQGLPVGLQGLPVSFQAVPLASGSVFVHGAAGDAGQNAYTPPPVYESVVDAEAGGHYQRPVKVMVTIL